jgi:hypothetical protein
LASTVVEDARNLYTKLNDGSSSVNVICDRPGYVQPMTSLMITNNVCDVLCCLIYTDAFYRLNFKIWTKVRIRKRRRC